MGRYVAHLLEIRYAYKIFIGKPEGKRQLIRLKHRWEDSVRMDLLVIWWEVVDWIHVVQDRDQW
jgi:hypothetical protein